MLSAMQFPGLIVLMGANAIIAAACLFFGFRAKGSLRWLLLIFAGVQVVGLAAVLLRGLPYA